MMCNYQQSEDEEVDRLLIKSDLEHLEQASNNNCCNTLPELQVLLLNAIGCSTNKPHEEPGWAAKQISSY